jgi:TonB family protein
MSNLFTLTPRLEQVLRKLTKQERSFIGRIQSRVNVWLTRIEAHPFFRIYGGFLRKQSHPALPQTRPAMDLDNLFFLSAILHLMVFLLVMQIKVTSPVTSEESPVVVRILDLAQRAEPSPNNTSKRAAAEVPRVPSQTPSASVPPKAPVEPKPVAPSPKISPAAVPEPVLPGPKVLAEVPRQNAPVAEPSPIESLVQLPTRQPGNVEPPIPAQVEFPPATAVGEVAVRVPEVLRRGEHSVKGAADSGSPPPLLSSPDFAPYLEMIKKRVQAVWKYPEGLTGSHRISVIFVLDRAGTLVRTEVADSSDPRLDQGALQAMRIASPFPPIPESLKELSGAPLRMRFNIDFGIKRGR